MCVCRIVKCVGAYELQNVRNVLSGRIRQPKPCGRVKSKGGELKLRDFLSARSVSYIWLSLTRILCVLWLLCVFYGCCCSSVQIIREYFPTPFNQCHCSFYESTDGGLMLLLCHTLWIDRFKRSYHVTCAAWEYTYSPDSYSLLCCACKWMTSDVPSPFFGYVRSFESRNKMNRIIKHLSRISTSRRNFTLLLLRRLATCNRWTFARHPSEDERAGGKENQ